MCSNEMKKLNFYVLWSLRDAPRQFSSKSSRRCFQAHIPLPLPKQLAIFGFGEWWSEETTLKAEVVVSGDVPAQRIGTLSSHVKCLTWEGDWSDDLVTVAAEKGRRGMYGKIVLKICGEDSSVLSSTPLAQRKCLFPEESNKTDLSSTINHTTETINDDSCLESRVEIQESKLETSDSPHPAARPTNSTPRPLLTTQPGCITWSSEQTKREDAAETLFSKKRKLSWRSSQEELCVQIKKENRGASACPSKRWSHTMCLSDPDTAILIGGETSEQNYCKDSVWKLELDGDLWFPMNSSAFGPVPPCTRGHTATFDPDSKTVYVYGGLKESQSYWDLHILDTLTWKWRLVTTKGKVPNLAFHSAVFYKKELYVFGGVQPGHPQGDQLCSNALYIFNPEHELWYMPIVEGSKPLPRFGHSATLLAQKLVIFGGRKTSTYLNDLHVLDLGLMEYTAVKCANMPPLPRGFHAAVPVLGNRVLISGGCSAVGALQDAHIFNVDTRTWSSVASPQLCCKPRAGHSVISLGCAVLADSEGENANTKLTLLVLGGSDCSGSFYDDTTKCIVEISGDN
nr:rab9 effector protein with kelch motifs isoform X2 [Nothobranchius furzeri]